MTTLADTYQNTQIGNQADRWAIAISRTLSQRDDRAPTSTTSAEPNNLSRIRQRLQRHFKFKASQESALQNLTATSPSNLGEWLRYRSSPVFLRGVDFTGTSLAEVNFAGHVLVDINFAGADLTNASFEGATLLRCDFTGANLTGVIFGHQDPAELKGLTLAQLALLPETGWSRPRLRASVRSASKPRWNKSSEWRNRLEIQNSTNFELSVQVVLLAGTTEKATYDFDLTPQGQVIEAVRVADVPPGTGLKAVVRARVGGEVWDLGEATFS